MFSAKQFRALCAVLIGCLCSASLAIAQPGTVTSSIKAFENLVYKISPGKSELKLDVFLPDTIADKNFPLLIIIHGGGWALGDKTLETIYYMKKLKQELLNNGIAVASIDYSLVSKDVHLPTPVEDCKDAIKWLYANATQYNLDTTNFGLWGGSAGGHLALLAAYSGKEQFKGDSLLMQYPSQVKYVVDNFGPTEMNDLLRVDAGKFTTFIFKIFFRKIYNVRERLSFALTGYHLKTDKEKLKEINHACSPLYYVSENAVPTLIFHGTKDRVVPYAQSEKLKALLDRDHIENEFVTVAKGDHGFNNISQEETDKLVDKTVEFIKGRNKQEGYRLVSH
ncbi:alpha/beta hydrolase [Terrimonas sp.]|uniref:alpha/beta hydrolase n=1 Tax=Terrimonas sp. TaxID=1914338 RepID=UPI000D52475E|nr:alpha/beta hydrolase [Terrimonas sp.]PVD50029.1 alpha/beta hydrolase [Terrimonas sp.]